MGKRKRNTSKNSALRKKMKQDDGLASENTTGTTQSEAAQGTAIPAPTVTDAPSTTQEQASQTLAIAPPAATEATSSTVPPYNEDGATTTPVGAQAAQDSSIAPSVATETTTTVHEEDEAIVAQTSTSEVAAPSTPEDTKNETHSIALSPDILRQIFYECILRGPPELTPGAFNTTPWHFNGFNRSVIQCSTRATLRSVCKQWADLIADEINLWRDIHIDGKRIPSPPKDWPKGHGPQPENYRDPRPEDEIDLPVVDIVGEMPRAALSVERSQDSPINLVLVDPSYDPFPQLAMYGRPFLPRPGISEFIRTAMDKPKIGSLSISTADTHFVKDLLDPGVYLDRRYLSDRRINALTYSDKVSLTCDGEEADHFDHFDVSTLSTSDMNNINLDDEASPDALREAKEGWLRKKFKAWPELHTLRICTRDRDYSYDQERCAFLAERAPALRHLELELPSEHRLWLWTFPYPQLTHLTLATEEPDAILLGIISRCVSLESLTITLRNLAGADSPLNAEQVELFCLKKLCIQIHHPSSNDRRLGRNFINYIDTPRLQSLDRRVSWYEPSHSISNRRCFAVMHHANQYLYIPNGVTLARLRRAHFVMHKETPFYRGSEIPNIPPHSNSGVTDPAHAEKFNIRELMYLVSGTLKYLAIQSGPMDGSWLEEFSAPHLQKIVFLCFGIEKERYKGKDVDDVHGAAHDMALYVLRWAEKWVKGATQEEKGNRSITFVAGPRYGLCDCDGTEALYGDNEFDTYDRVPCPDTVSTMVSRIAAMGGVVDVLWTTLRYRTREEKIAWRKENPDWRRRESRLL
ncbi:hypothetical protein DFP72DRAFT_857803 [Ephemerocybe angulata]|uniref:F-box domain-containing protein n=1 Tax=Ephemerocybe angulata TaxID=980116 RepID=A0A8H6HD30_9AGAR|nr:hypothetical protein DFP72DRAFT_857803 [Tulosesus angulatus]